MSHSHIEIRIVDKWWTAFVHDEAGNTVELARVLLDLAQDSADIRGSFIDVVQIMVEHVINRTGGKITDWQVLDMRRNKLN